MHDVSGELTAIHDPVEAVRAALEAGRDDTGNIDLAGTRLQEIALSAEDAARDDLAYFARQLAGLLEIAGCSLDDTSAAADSNELIDFVLGSLPTLQVALDEGDEGSDELRRRAEQAQAKWGDCLQLVVDRPDDHDLWKPIEDSAEERDSDEHGEHGEQVGLILTSLCNVAPANDSASSAESDDPYAESGMFEQPAPSEHAEELVEQQTEEPAYQDEQASAQEDTPFPDAPTQVGKEPELDEVQLDDEIREAYLDDAQRCLASIESSLLAFENEPGNRQPLKQVCRELHTLKGASASVGLQKLAHFLHTVEDDLQAQCDQPTPVEIESILKGVDLVRRQIERLKPDAPSEFATLNPADLRAAHAERFVDASPPSQESVRVKTAQLDRLMDMLAELVMLRNRRESRVEELKLINSELVHCVSRLRAYEEGCPVTSGVAPASEATEHRVSRARSNRRQVSSLTEIANDLLDLGRNLRELYEPVGDENLAISRFIRQFRQELMQLRRVPVGGLFRRLQRATRDAAKTENKQVRLRLIGEDVGLEKSVQEQLYDPLLHIVRNAVSHGVESESERAAQGKHPAGTITLEAHGGSNLLVITVRDDGRGLDYDAIRRRGVEMGLISVDRAATRSELARLIFHAGFSTRTETTELAGRGVGMDVVASTLDRLHSWIEVDSVPGEGTSIRLLIPLHSVIEHATVFRSSGQEFAVPTQFVNSAGPWDADEPADFPILPFSELCPGIPADEVIHPQLLVVAHGWEANEDEAERAGKTGKEPDSRPDRRLGLLVDEIVGPEEVVVRPLPGLLRDQRLFAGVTLSGTGDIMLLFDSQRLLERGLTHKRDPQMLRNIAHVSRNGTENRKRVLVVDDSRSSRRALIQLLNRHDVTTDQAADGIEALKLIRQHTYDIVFTDLEMPQMNGFELVRKIRGAENTEQLPIIMVSSRDEDAFQQKAKKLGVIDYLTKPVSDKTLSQTLQQLDDIHLGNRA